MIKTKELVAKHMPLDEIINIFIINNNISYDNFIDIKYNGGERALLIYKENMVGVEKNELF